MQQEVYQVTVSGLLHDYGKILYRSSIVGREKHAQLGYSYIGEIIKDQQILDGIRYHHYGVQPQAGEIPQDAPAYIVYIADNIASAIDRREQEGADSKQGFATDAPLDSVFNRLNGNKEKKQYSATTLSKMDKIHFPKEQVASYTAGYYNKIHDEVYKQLKIMNHWPDYISSLLSLLEMQWSYVPASTDKSQVPDISLYDHSKMTAAIGSCIALYLDEQGRGNYQKILVANSASFYKRQAFLLYSFQLSGIQSFLYTISGEKGLKSLRARSFYMELLSEHLIDEILAYVGLSRANVLYSGAGQAQLLLPNTQQCKQQLEKIQKTISKWLIQHFGDELKILMAYAACSANALMGKDQESYGQVLDQVKLKLQVQKYHPFSAQDIIALNNQRSTDYQRECKECKRVDHIHNDLCPFCFHIQAIANDIMEKDRFFVVLKQAQKNAIQLPLPSMEHHQVYLAVADQRQFIHLLPEKNLLRYYTKNSDFIYEKLGAHLWFGDYYSKNQEQTAATFEQLAQGSTGIQRLAVMRLDVDDLGKAFSQGFHDHAQTEYYATISRVATLSAQLSLFFKQNINCILQQTAELPMEPVSLSQQSRFCQRVVSLVYAGGDDLFLVGAWDQVIEVALQIQQAFSLYCQNTLTISAGIGIYPDNYPLLQMAIESGTLLEQSKQQQNKNSISIFGEDQIEHCYCWEVFSQQVIGEKLRFLQKYLQQENSQEKAFVYKMLALLRDSTQSINLARFAYLISRKSASNEALDQQWNDTLYGWYLSHEHRRQLTTAIYLYIYLLRA